MFLKTSDKIWIFIFFGLAFLASIAPAMGQERDWSPDHVDFLAGPSLWNATSNNNGVESDADPGVAFMLSLGWNLGDYLSADISAGGWVEPLHGRNGDEHDSADGRNGYFGTITPGLWLRHDLGEIWTFYGGGGAGLGYAHVFGDGRLTYALSGGAGLLLDLAEDWRAQLAYRYTRFGTTEHDGLDARFNTHTVMLGVRYEF